MQKRWQSWEGKNKTRAFYKNHGQSNMLAEGKNGTTSDKKMRLHNIHEPRPM